jgi:hypothetical protein
MAKLNNNSLNQLVAESDTTGTLQLQVNSTTGLTLNSSLAVGVGSTPNYGTAGQVLASAGTSAPATWSSTVTNATNIVGGVAGAVPYQTAPGATGFTAAGTAGQVFTSAGTNAPTWATPATPTALAANATVTSLLETATITAAAPTATTNYDVKTQSVQYYTSNTSTNWTLNVRGDGTTTLNTVMATGQAITIVLMATNGASAFYGNALTIDGTSVTPKWQTGTAPTSGNVNSIDAYVYTIIKTASATYTVLASLTKYA